ncbi:deoxyribodipyrimidine photolyase-related protein [Maribacter caenipelagi]|uniref:Deoxyribodipyrimidine photolyase-related protein n=1 Tax=Maribacter caenipelagi TaxID=1447781 RepID=A0A4R7CTZ1_9FLAO|nr:cryptochrome/photolyase family protein [Maribacter caenipelagi]TDS11570.1 deoxyribodipyrimidine photolyase-related protein [Maribacter caenipelagi]
MKIVRLILGDQLNQNHSWFSTVNNDITYVMAEMRQETDYVKHHVQKVVAFFLAMRNFKEDLSTKGHRFIYYKLNDKKNPQKLEQIILKTIQGINADKFEYQLPDEFRLDQQLEQICSSLNIATGSHDTEHFYTTRFELKDFYKGKKQMVMESFYRMMRKKHDIMVQNSQPEGGKWNYDQSNRNKWKGQPPIPKEKEFVKNVDEIIKLLKNANVQTIGEIDSESFAWPVTREECLTTLDYFCNQLLPHFGDYQDAMHTDKKFLFHSRLSFAMNAKILSPKEVIDAVLNQFYDKITDINISQVEGFIRQILGWREYMRGIYWKEMPEYKKLNTLNNTNKLPDFFWTGNTKMNCLKKAIGQSLDASYAHHIQRLMVIGNFALLTQIDPDEVDNWYLGVYIDAIEWVEITNTRGMSQFADGGIVATKPYVSSANYINKMSNYCGNCHYSHTKKIGDKACPFNSLYWNFLSEKREHFKENQRMNMMMALLNKMESNKLAEIQERATFIINNLDEF